MGLLVDPADAAAADAAAQAAAAAMEAAAADAAERAAAATAAAAAAAGAADEGAAADTAALVAVDRRGYRLLYGAHFDALLRQLRAADDEAARAARG